MRVGEVDQTFFRSCMADTDTGCLLARGAHLSPFRLNTERTPGKERFLHLDRYLEMKGAAAEACLERASRRRIAQLGIRNMHSRPRLVAALAPPGIHLGNSINVYFPHDGIALEYVAGLLNATLLDWLFRLTSGNNNINLHEMRRLPIPKSPPEYVVANVIEAYRACEQAAESGADLKEARDALDQSVAECYGLGDIYNTLSKYINE